MFHLLLKGINIAGKGGSIRPALFALGIQECTWDTIWQTIFMSVGDAVGKRQIKL